MSCWGKGGPRANTWASVSFKDSKIVRGEIEDGVSSYDVVGRMAHMRLSTESALRARARRLGYAIRKSRSRSIHEDNLGKYALVGKITTESCSANASMPPLRKSPNI